MISHCHLGKSGVGGGWGWWWGGGWETQRRLQQRDVYTIDGFQMKAYAQTLGRGGG